MSKRSTPLVYVAFHDQVWSLERPEFRAFLAARARGITEGECDPRFMGNPLKSGMSHSSRSLSIRDGFPRSTDGHARYKMTEWTPEQYRNCLLALDQGTVFSGIAPH